MPRRQILLADDHRPTLAVWRSILQPEFEVVGEVMDGRLLVDAYMRTRPEVAVLDVVLPGVSGLDAAQQILARHPAARIVFVTIHAERALLRRAVATGAFGFVLKARVGDDLLLAVRAALRGELHVSRFPSVPADPRRNSNHER